MNTPTTSTVNSITLEKPIWQEALRLAASLDHKEITVGFALRYDLPEFFKVRVSETFTTAAGDGSWVVEGNSGGAVKHATHLYGTETVELPCTEAVLELLEKSRGTLFWGTGVFYGTDAEGRCVCTVEHEAFVGKHKQTGEFVFISHELMEQARFSDSSKYQAYGLLGYN